MLIIIDEYLDGETDSDATAAAEAHLAGCADCRRELEKRREYRRIIASSAPEPSAGLHDKIMMRVRAEASCARRRKITRRIAAVAAAIVLTVGLSASWSLIGGSSAADKDSSNMPGGDAYFDVTGNKTESSDYNTKPGTLESSEQGLSSWHIFAAAAGVLVLAGGVILVLRVRKSKLNRTGDDDSEPASGYPVRNITRKLALAAAVFVLAAGVAVAWRAGVLRPSSSKAEMAAPGNADIEDGNCAPNEAPNNEPGGADNDLSGGGLPAEDDGAEPETGAANMFEFYFSEYGGDYGGGIVIFADGVDDAALSELAERLGCGFDGRALAAPDTDDVKQVISEMIPDIWELPSASVGEDSEEQCIIIFIK